MNFSIENSICILVCLSHSVFLGCVLDISVYKLYCNNAASAVVMYISMMCVCLRVFVA